MKNFKFIILGFAAIGILHLTGCNKNNLDLAPHSPSENEYFKTPNQFNRTVFGAYAKMADFFSLNTNVPLIYAWLLPGDDVTDITTKSYETFEGNSPSDGYITQMFQYPYQIINRTNIVLDKYAGLDQGGLDKKDIESIKNTVGEAYFLRGFWYLWLMNYYGKNIPLVLHRMVLGENGVTKEDLNIPSAGDYLAILDQCISDLKAAVDLLPDKWPDIYLGRVTKDAAYGLLGKLYVYRACYGSSASQDYQNALTAFNSISSDHGLTDNFSDNFNVSTENNKESLFEFQASNAPTLDNVWLANDFDIAIGRMSAFYSCFDNTWGYHWWGNGTIIPTNKLLSMYDTVAAARDPRFDETFAPADFPYNTGFMIVKFTKYSQNAGDFGSFSSTNNLRLLRMADVLLLKAEALAQTGDLPGAIDLVNQIRTRARNSGGSTAPADRPSSSDKNEVMGWIMDERMLELAAEGQRWPDLKRWDAAGYIDLGSWTMSDFSPVSDVESSFKFDYPNDLVYPIPETELNNNPNIAQNPGY